MSDPGPYENPRTETPSDGGAGSATGQRLTGFPLLIVALCVVLFVQALFVFSYVGALHAPKAHDVALGVVGTSPIPVAVGKQFSLATTRYADEAAAREAIDQRDIVGAFVTGPAGSKLIVAPAAGPATATALGTAFGIAAAAFDQKLEVVQVRPLPPGDRAGVVSFLVVMALVVGGYLSATIALAYGRATARAHRLAALGAGAVLGALLTDVLAGPVLGALPTDKFFALWALFTLVMMAVAFAAAGLQSLLGAAGTLVVVVVFVIFGAPAAGGTVPAAFLPTFWRTIGPYLPAGAGTTAVRNTLYFDGNAIGGALLVLAVYLVLGALVVLTIRRRGQRVDVGEAEASVAAVVVP